MINHPSKPVQAGVLVARVGICGRVARGGDVVVVEPVAIDGQDQIVRAIVVELLLVQNNIARDIVGIGPGGIAAAIGLVEMSI